MPNWTKSMQQTFEYYIVDPGTWSDTTKLDTVKSCSITRDSDTATLASASFEFSRMMTEHYVRPYLVTVQNGVKERFPLGAFLIQTPSWSFNGKSRSISVDAYSPLIELSENQPSLGYSIPKGKAIMDTAYRLTTERVRAPVIKPSNASVLQSNFISNTDDTWLTFNTDLIAKAKYAYSLDSLGRITYQPIRDITALQPRVIFNDDNSSILMPDVTINRDLYGIPNVVEVICSSGNHIFHARVVNNSKDSPISTVNRGREIVHRVTNPSLIGTPSQTEVNEYAKQLLKSLSTLEYTVSYTHGYYPVSIGDCVLLNYEKAGINNQKAKIISQTINCTPGTPVTEKAVYTTSLWG